MSDAATAPHDAAAEGFVTRVSDECGDDIEQIIVYGSVARGETRGVDSDVDLIVIHRDDTDQDALEDRVRQIAYEVELEQGIVLSLIVMSATQFERESGSPFFRHVERDGRRLYGST